MFYLIFPANKGSNFIKSTAKTAGLPQTDRKLKFCYRIVKIKQGLRLLQQHRSDKHDTCSQNSISGLSPPFI